MTNLPLEVFDTLSDLPVTMKGEQLGRVLIIRTNRGDTKIVCPVSKMFIRLPEHHADGVLHENRHGRARQRLEAALRLLQDTREQHPDLGHLLAEYVRGLPGLLEVVQTVATEPLQGCSPLRVSLERSDQVQVLLVVLEVGLSRSVLAYLEQALLVVAPRLRVCLVVSHGHQPYPKPDSVA